MKILELIVQLKKHFPAVSIALIPSLLNGYHPAILVITFEETCRIEWFLEGLLSVCLPALKYELLKGRNDEDTCVCSRGD